MKQTITQSMFIDDMRAIRPDNFSYEGLQVLFDYLDEMDSDFEFDPIAICCDFSQCSLDEFIDSFDIEIEDANITHIEDAKRDAISQYIENNGFWYCFVEDGKEIVFNNF